MKNVISIVIALAMFFSLAGVGSANDMQVVTLDDNSCAIALCDGNSTVEATVNFDGQVPSDVRVYLNIYSEKYGSDKVKLRWKSSLGLYGKYYIKCSPDYFVQGTQYTFSINVTSKNTSVQNYSSPKTLTVGNACSSTFVRPLTKKWRITQNFSSTHFGIDLAASKPGVAGDPVVSAIDGKVVRADKSTSYGWVVYINSNYNGTYIQTRYAHLKAKPKVKKNATVSAGDLIGYMGNTGESRGVHLHFEVRISPNGRECSTSNTSEPVDPLEYIN